MARYGNPPGGKPSGGNPGGDELDLDLVEEMEALEDEEDDDADPFLRDAAIRAFPELEDAPERLDALLELVRGFA